MHKLVSRKLPLLFLANLDVHKLTLIASLTVAAASVGKSRWGDKEVERAMESNGATVTVAPPTTAISLDDRVNLGARLLGAN